MDSLSQKRSKLWSEIEEFETNNKNFTVQKVGGAGISEDLNIEEINENYVTSNEDINIIEKKIVNKSKKVNNKMQKKVQYFCGGLTTLGNFMFWDYVIPNIKEAMELNEKKKYKDALAVIWGVSQFLHNDEAIIYDNEVYCDMEEWSGIYSNISEVWRLLLEQNSQNIGFYNEQTKENMKSYLKDFERDLNKKLTEYDDFVEGDEYFPRIEIFEYHQPQKPKKQKKKKQLWNDITHVNNPQEEEQQSQQSQQSFQQSQEQQQLQQQEQQQQQLEQQQQQKEEEKEEEDQKSIQQKFEDDISISSKRLSEINISSQKQDMDDEKNEAQQVIGLKRSLCRDSLRNQDVKDILVRSRNSQQSKSSQKKEKLSNIQ